ncbi:MAG TPA: hypothetical protein VEJ40_08045 [Pseudolabrys sp.]|nr:hypothetical protein [Pseudolabrys sp.]
MPLRPTAARRGSVRDHYVGAAAGPDRQKAAGDEACDGSRHANGAGRTGHCSPACGRAVSATTRGAPAAAIAAAPAAPQEVEPEPSDRPGGLAPAAVGKGCARYIFMHCRGIQPGEGHEVACLTNYVNQGNFVGPRCRATLQLIGHLR